jgi:hypothetical protein
MKEKEEKEKKKEKKGKKEEENKERKLRHAFNNANKSRTITCGSGGGGGGGSSVLLVTAGWWGGQQEIPRRHGGVGDKIEVEGERGRPPTGLERERGQRTKTCPTNASRATCVR